MTIKELAKMVLKSNKFGKLIYPGVQCCYQLFSVPKKRRLLQRNGLSILKNIDCVLGDLDIEYFVDYGTLLGVIREGKFINTDDDIDITICAQGVDARTIVRQFIERGFKFIHSIKYRGEAKLFSMSWRGTTVDFFLPERSEDRSEYLIYGAYFDPHIKYPSEEWNSCYRVCYPLRLESERIQFMGAFIRVPRCAEDHLMLKYGANWRTPDPKCKDAPEKNVVAMPNFAKRVISLEEFLAGG